VNDSERERQDLMHLLRQLLKDYNEALATLSTVRQLGRAPQDHVENLRGWLGDFKQAILPKDEIAFLTDQSYEYDLVSIVPRERNLLEKLVENSSGLIEFFFKRKEKERPIPPDVDILPGMQFFSEKMVQRAVKWIVIVIGLAGLLAPMNILRVLPNNYLQPLVTSIFVCAFTLYMSAFTLAKAQEILASAAAYAAVLVVFMSNQNSPNTQSSTP